MGGVAPTILATHYKDPPKILEEHMEIKEIGNLKEGQQSWKSPQTGRVYDVTGISPTLNTCGGGGHEVKIVEKKVMGGIYTDVTENFNRGLYPDVSRTVKAVKNDAGCIERQIVASRGRNPDNPSDRTAGMPTEQVLEPNADGVCNALTTVQKDSMILEKRCGDVSKIKESGKILRILRKEIGEESFCEWAIRGLWCILAQEILQQNVYAESVFENWREHQSDKFKCPYNSTWNKQIDLTEKSVRRMWKDWKDRCASYRRKLPQQYTREFDGIVQELPHEETQRKRYVCNLWETCEGVWTLQQALLEIQEIWKPNDNWKVQWTTYRVRKLTPREVWRLMGFSDEDYEKAAEVNSKTQLYKQAGNSIVKDVLMAIFSQLNIKGVPMWNEVHHGTK